MNFSLVLTKLIAWSEENFSNLPWRRKRNLYYTLVSEIMLQQTTVGTVKNHFERFIKEYPNIESLALSSEAEILRSWKGLGYYRRAKNLRKAALDILEFYEGKIPCDLDDLKSIKGIGDYTANALLAIGLNRKALALDANLERVLARIFLLEEKKGKELHKKLQILFNEEKILKEMAQLGPRSLTEALMDLGREFCRAQKTLCLTCPVNSVCKAYLKSDPLLYPRFEKKNQGKFFQLDLLRLVIIKKDQILAYQKEEKEWLGGQWELPTFILYSEDKKLKQYPSISISLKKENCFSYKTSITKYKITNYILECDEKTMKDLKINFKNYQYHKLNSQDLSTASLKALAYLKR